MRMYSYDQVLTDVKDVYEQITGPAREIDLKKAVTRCLKESTRWPWCRAKSTSSTCLINSGVSWRLAKSPAWAPPRKFTRPRKLYNQPGVAGVEPGRRQSDSDQQHPHGPGKRRFKKANEEAIYHSSERNYGTFERLFPLPNNVLAERIKSKFTNGILQITIPKTKVDLSGRSED